MPFWISKKLSAIEYFLCCPINYSYNEVSRPATHKLSMSDEPNPDWQEDVDLMKNIRVDVYRFSISWLRVFPSMSGVYSVQLYLYS
jgi:hypothetical protein